MSLKLYYDLMSQPSRALYILLKTSQVDFISKKIKLGNGEQNTKEFAAINRFEKVPAIEHNGFNLGESVAIMKYLSQVNLVPQTIYPQESKQKARVEEFLSWQHIGLRIPCSLYFREIFMKPVRFGKQPNPQMVVKYKKDMISALQMFEEHWLSKGTEFLVGDTATVADLLAACELEQPRLAGYNPLQEFDKIGAWWGKVREHFNPHYDEAHVILNKVCQKVNASTSQ